MFAAPAVTSVETACAILKVGSLGVESPADKAAMVGAVAMAAKDTAGAGATAARATTRARAMAGDMVGNPMAGAVDDVSMDTGARRPKGTGRPLREMVKTSRSTRAGNNVGPLSVRQFSLSGHFLARSWPILSIAGSAVAFLSIIFPTLAASRGGSPPSEAIFVLEILIILFTSRVIGEGMQRLGQPAVVGHLLAGVLLGPSVFGLISPSLQHSVFPDDAAQKAMLAGIANFGVLLLLLLTGMDTDVGLIRKVGRPAVSVSLAGIAIPFACGVGLGSLLPESLIPNPEQRLATALFLGVALSISSIKIVAIVVHEMNFMRRDLGQIIIASAVIEDSIGWIIIAIVFGIAREGSIQTGPLSETIVGVVLFLALSFMLGRRAVAVAIRFVNDNFVSELPVVTLILIIMASMALITDGLGVQSVLGAYVAGLLIGESPILTKHISAQLRGMIASLFAPIFFAIAGLSADLTALHTPELLMLTLGLIVIASVGKFAGAFVGGAIARLSRAEFWPLPLV